MNVVFNIILNVLRGKLVPRLSLLSLLTYFVFWIETIVVLCYNLVLRVFTAMMKAIHCISPSTEDPVWHLATAPIQATSWTKVYLIVLAEQTKLHRHSFVCLVDFLPVLCFLCVFLSFSFIFPPCLCWSCHCVNRRPSNPQKTGFPKGFWICCFFLVMTGAMCPPLVEQ